MKVKEFKQINLKGGNKKIMKTKIEQEKGITLIALVVTIVVLLILAGVSINAIFSDNGIIARAQNAQNKMNEAQQNDLTAINNLNNWIDNQVNETTGGNVSEKTISFTVDGTTYQAKEGMTWKQAFEAGYFDDKKSTEDWYEMYGTAEKQKDNNGKYWYSGFGETNEYIVTDAKSYKIMVYNNRLYNKGIQYFKADGSFYDYRGNSYDYIIPEGSVQSESSQVMPDDVITENGIYVIYDNS